MLCLEVDRQLDKTNFTPSNNYICPTSSPNKNLTQFTTSNYSIPDILPPDPVLKVVLLMVKWLLQHGNMTCHLLLPRHLYLLPCLSSSSLCHPPRRS
uniref:Uncharacterized protein n=1 Tax=Arundo donax TaxID=35708 RepID=A0A0A9AFD2_ARUDO